MERSYSGKIGLEYPGKMTGIRKRSHKFLLNEMDDVFYEIFFVLESN